MNVTLRPLRDGDDQWLDAWLGACAATAGYAAISAHDAAGDLRRALGGGLTARVIAADTDTDVQVGVVLYSVSGERATIVLVGVQPSHARRGLGHAAAAGIEDELRAAGARHVVAPAPAVHGIAMYFWIRLGYRPLRRDEWPCEREGVAWLQRDL